MQLSKTAYFLIAQDSEKTAMPRGKSPQNTVPDSDIRQALPWCRSQTAASCLCRAVPSAPVSRWFAQVLRMPTYSSGNHSDQLFGQLRRNLHSIRQYPHRRRYRRPCPCWTSARCRIVRIGGLIHAVVCHPDGVFCLDLIREIRFQVRLAGIQPYPVSGFFYGFQKCLCDGRAFRFPQRKLLFLFHIIVDGKLKCFPFQHL